MNIRKTLFIAFLAFGAVPAVIFLAFLNLPNVNIFLPALGLVLGCAFAAWNLSDRYEQRFAKPLLMLAEFFRRAAQEGGYPRCELDGDAGEAAKRYNVFIEKMEHEHSLLADQNARLKDDYAELKEENKAMCDRERDLIDLVTGLPNNMAFKRRLSEMLEQHIEGGIVYVDVNHFLYINKMLGRESGDRLLKELGKRIVGIGIAESFCTRYSDDKFAAAVKGGQKDIELFCRYLSDSFIEPFESNEALLRVEAGIGAVMFSEGGDLMEKVHQAMLRSRELDASFYLYDEILRLKMKRYAQILSILRDSILRKEIFLVYQPQLVLDSGEIKILEALLRIKNKELGYISPAEFIPIAEANGLMLQLGYWVIEEACDFLNRSAYNGIVAVNVSTVEIFDNKFVDKVSAIIKRTGIEPNKLMLEIKEHMAAESFEREMQKLNVLRKMGVAIAMDNFGTVYSSLNHMANLPIDIIKIDRSFVHGMFIDQRKRVIVRSIIETAHTLGLGVVAEGVEDDEQRRFLHENGCDMIQGYVFSAPLDEEGLEELIENHSA